MYQNCIYFNQTPYQIRMTDSSFDNSRIYWNQVNQLWDKHTQTHTMHTQKKYQPNMSGRYQPHPRESLLHWLRRVVVVSKTVTESPNMYSVTLESQSDRGYCCCCKIKHPSQKRRAKMWHQRREFFNEKKNKPLKRIVRDQAAYRKRT